VVPRWLGYHPLVSGMVSRFGFWIGAMRKLYYQAGEIEIWSVVTQAAPARYRGNRPDDFSDKEESS
jgi:hypothetical protein